MSNNHERESFDLLKDKHAGGFLDDFRDEILDTARKFSKAASDNADGPGVAVRNLDKIITVMQHFPDGTYPVGEITPFIGKVGNSDVLRDMQTITKNGNHYEIVRKQPLKVAIDNDLPVTGSIDDLRVDKKVTFDVENADGKEKLKNIHGLKVEFSLLGISPSSDINSAQISRDKDGNIHIKADMDNPIGLGMSSVQPELRINNEGKVELLNAKEVATKVAVNNPVSWAISPASFVVGQVWDKLGL